MGQNQIRIWVFAGLFLAGMSSAFAYTPGDEKSDDGTGPSAVKPGGLSLPSVDQEVGEETDAFPEENEGFSEDTGLPAAPIIDFDLETAKRAIDALDAVHEDFNNTGLDQYETLEDFVANTEAGKKFESRIKGFRFTSVAIWDEVITAISLTYHDVIDHESESLHEKIQTIQANRSYDEETKDKLIAEIESLIPSTNNRQVVQELLDDNGYREKLERLLTLE